MSSTPQDSELLRRYVSQGSEQAFAALVERHLSLVYGTAVRQLRDASLAEDVVQKTFVTLNRRAIWLLGHSSLSGWLHRTAINLARHTARSEGRRRQREQTAIELGTTMKSENIITKELSPVLDELLLELRAKDREVLLLRYVSNKSLREVAEALGIREDAAQKRVSKAMNAITESFRRRGFQVAGVTALATALQGATALAVPAGLAAATTKAAVGAGTATSLGVFTTTTVKIMSLTKAQTLGVCIAIAAVPLGYKWHALSEAQNTKRELNHQLSSLRSTAIALENDQARAENRAIELNERLASRPAEPTSGSNLSATRTGKSDKNLYVWDENSDYIRIPRHLLADVQFGTFTTRTTRGGQEERVQIPPLMPDGTPHPSLEAALGLSEEERSQLTELNQMAFDRFFEVMAINSEIEEKPFLDDGRSVVLNTEQFEEYGLEFRRP